MQTINLNLVPGGVMPVINLTQFDEGRQFALAVYDGPTAVDLSTAQVLISGRKNDDTAFSYNQNDTVKGNAIISVSGNVVTVRNTLQMAAAAGEVLATLTIKRSASDESTLNFTLMVQEHPLDGVDISETEIPAIIELAQDQVDEAEAWANGMKGDTPVTSGDPQWHNNSKYWSDQAAQYAQGGLIWKGDCTFAQIPTTGMHAGDMWNITDAFTTDNRFKEGAGIYVNAGTNIAWDGSHWDLLATGSPAALPAGGVAGQTVVKNSSTDGDASWGGGVYNFQTLAAAQAAVSGGVVKNGATVLVDEIGGGTSVAPKVSNLADVQLTNLSNDQILKYDSTAGKWKNAANSASVTVDSVMSTVSENPLQNKVITGALANGRISFGVDSNGNFGYKKDGADTVYPFGAALTKTISDWIGPIQIGDPLSMTSGKNGVYGDLKFKQIYGSNGINVSGANKDAILLENLSAVSDPYLFGIGIAVPLNATAAAHPCEIYFGNLSGISRGDVDTAYTNLKGVWLYAIDDRSGTGQHFWQGAGWGIYYLYFTAA